MSSQLGYLTTYNTLNPSLPAGSAVVNTGTNIFADLTLPIGVWLVNYAIRLKTSSATASTIRMFSTWISYAGNATYPAQQGSSANQLIDNGVNSLFSSGSAVLALSSSATLNIPIFIGTGSTIVGNILHYAVDSNFIQYVRIG